MIDIEDERVVGIEKKKMRGPRWWEGQSSEEFGYRRENKKRMNYFKTKKNEKMVLPLL
jgi:hypothetical protein